jgi:hypothetical protein
LPAALPSVHTDPVAYPIRLALRDGWLAFLQSPVLLISWAALWWNLNSGYWVLRDYFVLPGTVGFTQAVRAAAPWIVLVVGVSIVYGHRQIIATAVKQGSILKLMAYGCIAFAASVLSPSPLGAFYFGAAFLAVVFCSLLMSRPIGPDTSIVRPMLVVNWVITAFAAVMIVIEARDLLLGSESAYGIIGVVDAKTRSSGAARFCAVPAVVALSRFVSGRGIWRWAWVPAFVAFLVLIFMLESRGAIFGLLFASAFIVLMRHGVFRSLFICGVLALAFSTLDPDMAILDRGLRHIRRGQTEEEFQSMTGRTRAWEKAIDLTKKSRLLEQAIGRGNWADRMMIDEHVHNTFLQALMLGGVIGLGFFIWSWVRAWRNFWFAYQRRDRLSPPDRYMLLESAAVFAFFTVRAIPETSNASFSVDLLVMAPIMVYFDVLAARLRGRNSVRVAFPESVDRDRTVTN